MTLPTKLFQKRLLKKKPVECDDGKAARPSKEFLRGSAKRVERLNNEIYSTSRTQIATEKQFDGTYR
jgi:hypothetical protein